MVLLSAALETFVIAYLQLNKLKPRATNNDKQIVDSLDHIEWL